jgi:hypothetical protein
VPGRQVSDVVWEGVIGEIADHRMVLALDDTRYVWVDLSLAEQFDSDLEKTLHIGDRVRVQAATSTTYRPISGSVQVIRSALLERTLKSIGASKEDTRRHATPASQPDAQSESQGNIQQVREEVSHMTRALPNFLCHQIVKRYVRRGPRGRPQLLDTVAAEVLYSSESGETYRNVEVNGKRTRTPFWDLGGTRSTGEFGSMLRSLFRSVRNSDFRFDGTNTIRGKQAREYSYRVRRAISDWKVESAFQFIIPAYSGQIWADMDSNRILKVRRIAEDVPEAFPFDRIESEAQYGSVRLGNADTYFLPIRAEMNACDRETAMCSRNVIEFTGYRKYTGESRIIFGQ